MWTIRAVRLGNVRPIYLTMPMNFTAQLSLRRAASRLPFIRPTVIRLLQLTAFDLTIKNPWTNDSLFINSFKHKGYWFFGRQREKDSMLLFEKYIGNGYTVLEVGGHIGYITQYFCHLVGERGRVIVFEPGKNNLPYLRQNLKTRSNVIIETCAISSKNSKAIFYEDNLTGQNNSLLSDNKKADFTGKSHNMKLLKQKREVEVTTLDCYIQENNLKVDFIKIVIEGLELNALLGMVKSIKHIKTMMVHVSKNQTDVSNILIDSGFTMFDQNGKAYAAIPENFMGNIFATKKVS